MRLLRVLQNKVVVKLDEAPAVVRGLHMPDSAKEQMRRGVVVGVGPGKVDAQGVLHETEVRLGDLVNVQDYHGGKVKLVEELKGPDGKVYNAGTEFLVVDEDDVLIVES